MVSERAYWLAWSRLDGVGPVTVKRLWEQFGSLAIAWEAPAGELLKVDGIGLLGAEKIVTQRPTLVPEALLAQHEADNQAFWTPADPEYPALLFTINDPPPVLYYRGSLRLNGPNVGLTVGMVGTRRPSAYGKRWTQKLSGQLTRQGAVIISGLAAGIDTEAHTSCLQRRGKTVAVLGTGVDVVYPHRNRRIYEQIATSGLVLSEYPDGTPPDKSHFPRRNRIIAGLSRAVLVMEAPARSGALITARLANDYCREVYALPCGLENPQGEGCLSLIDRGAQMILGEQSLVEALSAIPVVDKASLGSQPIDSPTPASDGEIIGDETAGESADSESTGSTVAIARASSAIVDSPDRLPEELSPLLVQVLEAVPAEPVSLDRIVQVAQIDTGQVLGALVQLELQGRVAQLPGMQYQRI